MKKLIVLTLVLGMASMANATVIDLVPRGLGDMGHSGTINDPLEVSETLYIDIVLRNNPYTHPTYGLYPYADGYALYGMDLDLHISGAGTLDHDKKLTGAPKLVWNSGFSVTGFSGVGDDGNISSINGGALSGFNCPYGQDQVLVSGIFIHCDGEAPVVLDLTLATVGQYAEAFFNGQPTPGWVALTEADLGDLVIYQPEPMTIALLGLGGLFLRRRK